MLQVMPTSGVFCVQRPGYVEVKSTSKHWPCLFPQHAPGRKHRRTIELEPWQQEIVTTFPGAFVRGLIHSDGCRFTKRVHHKLASGDRWYEALDQLGVSWRFSRRNTISVARREAVARLDEFVGPKY
jgi:hypothetical protein